MRDADHMLGFLHGFYGLGATVSPLIATTLVTKANGRWYHFYYLMVRKFMTKLSTTLLTLPCQAGIAVVEMITSVASFWKVDGQAYCEANADESDSNDGSMREALLDKKHRRVTWLCALFILGLDGVEGTLGGWIVTFMIRARHADPFASGIVATGFWLGSTVGSVALGFVTPRIGERWAVAVSSLHTYPSAFRSFYFTNTMID